MLKQNERELVNICPRTKCAWHNKRNRNAIETNTNTNTLKYKYKYTETAAGAERKRRKESEVCTLRKTMLHILGIQQTQIE